MPTFRKTGHWRTPVTHARRRSAIAVCFVGSACSRSLRRVFGPSSSCGFLAPLEKLIFSHICDILTHFRKKVPLFPVAILRNPVRIVEKSRKSIDLEGGSGNFEDFGSQTMNRRSAGARPSWPGLGNFRFLEPGRLGAGSELGFCSKPPDPRLQKIEFLGMQNRENNFW